MSQNAPGDDHSDANKPFAGLSIFAPLTIRDFALFWAGISISMLGDGIYFVAIAWTAYQIDNSPTSLSLIGFAWMAPQLVFLLIGGVLADRYERRMLLICADLLRAFALSALALLSLLGDLELWQAITIVAVYGVGEALFGPAFGAIVPELVPRRLLLQANALDQLLRPLAMRTIGPGIGGVIVAFGGAGLAFAIDAATFTISAAALLAIRQRIRPVIQTGSMVAELRAGLTFTRSQTWLWVTLLGAAVGLLLFYGPIEVLLPYLVKNDLHGGAGSFGAVVAAGGAGAVITSVLLAQRGLPRRHILVLYLVWGLGCAVTGLFALTTQSWHAMVVYFVSDGLFAAGMIIWATLMQRHVPPHLLGRVTSLDWFVSVSLIPLSFLLVAPVSEAIGVRTTLVAGGLLAGALTLAMLLVPGVRSVERRGTTGGSTAGSGTQLKMARGLDTSHDTALDRHRHP